MNDLRWKCLILDHDDTVVDSTAYVHHPAFLATMDLLRPGITMDLEAYFAMNCDPGIFRYFSDVVCLNQEEMVIEQRIWKSYVRERIPQVYPGMRSVIERQKRCGGLVCVVSHSDKAHVLRDYAAAGLPEPDMVFGGDVPQEHRKPSAWPVLQILDTFSLQPQDALIVDDLIPGFEMAEAANVRAVAACWAHRTPKVREYIRLHGIHAFDTPEIFSAWLQGEIHIDP